MSDEKTPPQDRNERLLARARRFKELSRMLGAIAAVMVPLFSFVGLHNVFAIPIIIVATVAAAVSTWATAITDRVRDAEIKEKESDIASIQSKVEPQETALSLLTKHTRLAIRRAEVSILRAERRANNLFNLGRAFMVASVVGPVLAAVLYWGVDPISPAAVQRVKEIVEVAGEMPASLNLNAERDWRILLGGVSFGFLLLAAARGLLGQQAKETGIFFALTQRIDRLERLIGVIEVRTHMVAQGAVEEKDAVKFVLDRLMANDGLNIDPKTGTTTDGGDGGESKLLAEILEAVKK